MQRTSGLFPETRNTFLAFRLRPYNCLATSVRPSGDQLDVEHFAHLFDQFQFFSLVHSYLQARSLYHGIREGNRMGAIRTSRVRSSPRKDTVSAWPRWGMSRV